MPMDDRVRETPAEAAARARAHDGNTQAALTIAISSRAVFALDDANQVWQNEGIEAYREHQRLYEEQPLAPGPAFGFVKRLLQLNGIRPGQPLVEVVLLSRNDPDTGLRAFNSIEHHGLPITRAAFLSGSSPYRYLKPFDASLFLSMNADDVSEAIAEGYPKARRLLPYAVDADRDAMVSAPAGVRVSKKIEVRPAIHKAMEHKGPFLIEFVVEPEENVYPFVPPGKTIVEFLEMPSPLGSLPK